MVMMTKMAMMAMAKTMVMMKETLLTMKGMTEMMMAMMMTTTTTKGWMKTNRTKIYCFFSRRIALQLVLLKQTIARRC